MKDYIVIAKHKDTKLFHALLYQNHPTPSGCDGPVLRLSTPTGRSTTQLALNDMTKALKPEYIEKIDVHNLNGVGSIKEHNKSLEPTIKAGSLT